MITFADVAVDQTFRFITDHSRGHFSSGQMCRKISETHRVYVDDKTKTSFVCAGDVPVVIE